MATIPGHTGDRLLLDIAADADDTHAVGTLKVVAQVEFVEVERDAELGVTGGEERGPDKGNDELGSVFNRSSVLERWVCGNLIEGLDDIWVVVQEELKFGNLLRSLGFDIQEHLLALSERKGGDRPRLGNCE